MIRIHVFAEKHGVNRYRESMVINHKKRVIALENGHSNLKMYFLLKKGKFPAIAMLVYTLPSFHTRQKTKPFGGSRLGKKWRFLQRVL